MPSALHLSSLMPQGGVDMHQLWDQRCRKYYKAQYDVRRNKIDWDYWMQLCDSGASGMTEPSIVHHREFMSWRLNGMAYSMHKDKATEPNVTLLSRVPARTKEFKNRFVF